MTDPILVKKLSNQDLDRFVELIRVFDVVFDMASFTMPQREYLQQLINQTNFLALVALSNNEVVGGLTAYVLPQYYTEKPLVYLYDLAISGQHQRRGIGRQLLRSLTNYGRQLGAEEMFVQADGDDAEAIDFYRATGGLAEQVVHFTYPLAT